MSGDEVAAEAVGVVLLAVGGVAVLSCAADGVPLPGWVVGLAWVGLAVAAVKAGRLALARRRAVRRVPDGFTSRYARGEWSE